MTRMTPTTHTDVLDPERNPMTDTMDVETAERTFDAVDVCARRFALAWRAVITAASDDDGRQALYRTVLVEQHPEGVRFPQWREALDTGKATGVRRVGLDADFLKTAASIRNDDRQAIDFEMLGAARGVNFTVPGDPKVYGRLMSVALPGDNDVPTA